MNDKNTNKTKNLSNIKYYTCKQKGHYANKCRKKSKNYMVVVLATFTSMTDKKTEEKFKWLPYIQYPVIFKDQTKALLDSKSQVNVTSQAFAYQLGLYYLVLWKGYLKEENT